jgi:uncharacterized protein YceK
MKKLFTLLAGALMLAVFLNGCSTAAKNTEPPPAPAPVVAAAPVDSDGDGVPDDRDKCPNTPPGVKVDADGCPIVKPAQRMEINVEFDFDKADVRPQYDAVLGDVAEFMAKFPSAVATIEGHTDSTGPESYNARSPTTPPARVVSVTGAWSGCSSRPARTRHGPRHRGRPSGRPLFIARPTSWRSVRPSDT